MMRRIAVMLLVALSLPALTLAQGINFIDNDLNKAMAKAKAENKTVFVDAYTTWCGPCKWLAAEVFTNDTLGEFYNKEFVNLKLDMEKGSGVEFAKKHNIQGYPTVLYISPEGDVLNGSIGAFRSTEKWLDMAINAIHPLKTFPAMKHRYERGDLSTPFIAAYTKRLTRAGMSTQEILQHYYPTIEPRLLVTPEVWDVTVNNRHWPESEAMFDLSVKYEKYIDYYGDEATRLLYETYYGAAEDIIYRDPFDETAFERYLQQMSEMQVPIAGRIEFEARITAAAHQKDWKKYEQLALAGTMDYVRDQPNVLNTIGWNFYENVKGKKSLKEAISWVDAALVTERTHYILDTKAHLLYKIGNAEAAIQLEKEAIGLAKEQGDDFKEYEDALAKFQS